MSQRLSEQTHSRDKFHEKRQDCMELNPHVYVSPETGFSHAEIRAATSKQNKEPNVCLKDTKSIVSVVLEHSVCSQCPSTALHQQNMTNLLNKYSFVLSAYNTLGLF